MKQCLLVAGLLSGLMLSAQVDFSLVTGISGLRNFSPKQKFWGLGQTVKGIFHFSPKESAYASLDYYSAGKYKNNFVATAKSAFVTPQQIGTAAAGSLLFRQVSLGWRHFFKGTYNQEQTINIYGTAGFGYLFTKVTNSFSVPVDTTKYFIETRAGSGKLDRLTFDISIGAELPLGGNFYAFADSRTWLPASSTGSPYLHSQHNVPLPVIVSGGLRLLFGFNY